MTLRYPLLWLLTGIKVLNAIAIDNYTSETNDRFTNNVSFVANSFDLSGIGISENGRWLTMVSSNVFLSAHHFYPTSNNSVTFYAGNDPNGESLTRTISYSERIGSSDLRIGYLDHALSADYAHYAIANTSISSSNFDVSPYHDADAYVFGRSNSSFSNSQDMAIGQNRLDHWVDNTQVGDTTDHALIAYNNQSTDDNYLNFEAKLESGDSGAPMLVDNAGSLTLVGINWFIGEDNLGNDLNGFSYLGNYSHEINTFIGAHAVPELGAASLYLAIFLIQLAVFKGRRTAI